VINKFKFESPSVTQDVEYQESLCLEAIEATKNKRKKTMVDIGGPSNMSAMSNLEE
jgi:methionine synthase II (cobalamin-independent)